MNLPRSCLWLLLTSGVTGAAIAQAQTSYVVPRTVQGDPDFQGVWATDFLTTLERPRGIEGLVVSSEDARQMAAASSRAIPGNIDPDFAHFGARSLARVQGEYRTSLIVDPEDGQMPFSDAGLKLAAWAGQRFMHMFDSADQRPLAERCLESLGDPPIRVMPIFLPRQIFQSRDTVAILSEDPVGLRLIPLSGQPLPDALRSLTGYSRGRWEGDTLVVETAHFRAEDPARAVFGRPVLISQDTRITERFTRVSDRELLYRFTVEDDELYTGAWTGEFSMTRHDVPIFEYACHEGNYSMLTVLRGGQVEASSASSGGREETR